MSLSENPTTKATQLNSFERISHDDYKKLCKENENIALLDTRDEQSYANGHMPGAVSVNNINFEETLKKIEPSTHVVVCCYSGRSSQGVAQHLSEIGFENSYSLDGGFEEYRQQQQ